MKNYKINRRGLRAMMKYDQNLRQQVKTEAGRILARARARAPYLTGELKSSGHLEEAIGPVMRGENRMKVFVVFDAPHAAAAESRTHFLSGSIARGPKR